MFNLAQERCSDPNSSLKPRGTTLWCAQTKPMFMDAPCLGVLFPPAEYDYWDYKTLEVNMKVHLPASFSNLVNLVGWQGGWSCDVSEVTSSLFYRKEDAIKLELVHIAKLDQNGTRCFISNQPTKYFLHFPRFFYQKKKFQLPQYVPYSLPGSNRQWISLFVFTRDSLIKKTEKIVNCPPIPIP